MTSIVPHIQQIGTATPDHDIHAAFIGWARQQIGDGRERALFERMAERAGIEHRWSVLPKTGQGDESPIAPGGFYADGMPPTSERMRLYAHHAPALAQAAIADLPEPPDPGSITHLVVASCTGFVAPGIDQILARQLGLPGNVERTLVGFMGCYGAVTALRTAYHITRSDPKAKVLVVSVELSSLHLSPEDSVEPLLAMLLFGDGAAAAIVGADETGMAMDRQFSATLPASGDLIRWDIGDTGFRMHLSGDVPARIAQALADGEFRDSVCGGAKPGSIDGWAVHAGGRTILDAVEKGLGLDSEALAISRDVLRQRGNMSSATLMFALQEVLAGPKVGQGVAMAFGPGLAVEGFGFRGA
ncbi:MAG: type III polyketide synthase [Sphingomonadaceae bacterium]|nr:type III polyketide synthase [Sphingomonadaceae bacterium]